MGLRGPAPSFDHHEALRLRELGHTCREVGTILGVNENAVRVATQRLRTRLAAPAAWWNTTRAMAGLE